MKVKTDDFKSALDIVKPALGNAAKEIVEQAASFAFIQGCVVTYNDEISIKTPLTSVKLEGVIKADELYKFLGKVKTSEFDITVKETEIEMKAGHAKVGFALNKEVLLPLDEVSEIGSWKDLPKNFLTACKFAAASASTDMTDPKLTCVHLAHKGVIEASNNHRLVVWGLVGEELPIDSTLVPASSIKEVIKIQPSQVAEGSGWIHFRNEQGTIISCRIFDEKYVDTEAILQSIKKTKKIEFPVEVLPVLEKAEIFTQEQKTNGSVELEFKNGKITVKSESSTAWFKESIAYDGDDEFTFSITPYLLKDILKQTNKCRINNNILKFVGPEWVYITSLRSYKA